MQVETITLDRVKARELYRKYKEHAHWSEPMDDEVRRAYQLIAQGRLVIRAAESIRAAGLNDQKLPKLAIARADAKSIYWRPDRNKGDFTTFRWGKRANEHHSHRITVQWPGMADQMPRGEAHLPLIPVHLRPKRGLANYHVLWEAEWTPLPPGDPYLLRRIGRADLWLVVAAWELTEIEKAVLSTRMNG